jgi:UDP-2-acetamido-3-amino-2,3-dideoxy-glucuronate N-acetyltransferase
MRGNATTVTTNTFLSAPCRREFALDSPALARSLPPLARGIQYTFSQDTVLAALCSRKYDGADYIRDYSEFLQLAQATG